MVLFSSDDGKIIEQPDNYDPNTGENLAINDFVSKVTQKGGNVTPVNIFQDEKGNHVAVKHGDEKRFLDLGLKPLEQIKNEELSQKSHEDLLKGKIGYTPSKTESFIGSAASGASANITPQVSGALEGVRSLSKGGSFGSGYHQGKDIAQALQANRETENPISSTLGNIVGSGITTAAIGGISSIPKMALANAGLGGISEGVGAVNKDKNVYETEQAAQEGTLTGGVVGAAGGYLGKGVQKVAESLGKAGYEFIPQSIRQAFRDGLFKNNLANSEINKDEFKVGATYAKKIADTSRKLKNDVGQAKSDILHEVGPVSYDDVFNLIDNEQENLVKDFYGTKYSHEKESIDNALNLLEETKGTLKLHPNDPVLLDKTKQKIGDIQYDDVKPIKKSKDALDSIHRVRSGIAKHLEDAAEKITLPDSEISGLGKTNEAYKNLVDIEEADKLHNIDFTPSEIISLGSSNPSASAVNKLDNFKILNDKIQNNIAVSNEIKQDYNTLLNDIETAASRATNAKNVAKGGLPNLANQIGYGISQTPLPLQTVGKLIFGVPQQIYKNLPVETQKMMELYPEYRKIMQEKIQNDKTRPVK